MCDTGAQPVFVVGAIIVLEVAVAVAGAAGESRHRSKRPPPSQACLVEFFVTLGAAFVGSCKGGQPDGVAPALMGGAQPERARARRLVLEGEGIVLVERLACVLVDQLAGVRIDDQVAEVRDRALLRSEEHTSELQSLLRNS